MDRTDAEAIAAALFPQSPPPLTVFPDGWAIDLPRGEMMVIERRTGEVRKFPASVAQIRIYDSYENVCEAGVVQVIPKVEV